MYKEDFERQRTCSHTNVRVDDMRHGDDSDTIEQICCDCLMSWMLMKNGQVIVVGIGQPEPPLPIDGIDMGKHFRQQLEKQEDDILMIELTMWASYARHIEWCQMRGLSFMDPDTKFTFESLRFL